jgi:hypothetical protein
MSYPAAPWTLKGNAILTLHLVSIDLVRPLVPSELNIVSILPGKTLGGVYFSKYIAGSVLEYSELIIIPVVVSYGLNFGGWVSHIYVDNPDSVAGGREIWGLPKELAEFHWEGNGMQHRLTVQQNSVELCALDYNNPGFAWPQWFSASGFSTKASNLMIFSPQLDSRLGFASSKLKIPAKSPFYGMDFGQPLLTVCCEDMTLKVNAPKVLN